MSHYFRSLCRLFQGQQVYDQSLLFTGDQAEMHSRNLDIFLDQVLRFVHAAPPLLKRLSLCFPVVPLAVSPLFHNFPYHPTVPKIHSQSANTL